MKTLPLLSIIGLALSVVCDGRAVSFELSGTLRDFNDSHPDFESTGGFDPGIVEVGLGADKKPVYAGETGNPTTHGQTAFDQWYRDVPGVNLSMPFGITLENGAPTPGGVYTYSNSSFFPLDGLLFGNQGRPHNYHFTFELHTEFTYEAGQSFSFTGDDDLWVFINDLLVIDLGGVHGALSDSVDLDTLGLTAGSDYDLDIFFAERHTTASNFRIDTSIKSLRTKPEDPVNVPEPGTMLGFSALLIGAASLARRRKP